MRAGSFLIPGFCISCFFHAAAFILVSPTVPMPPVFRSGTESFFLGAILKEVDVVPFEGKTKVSRRTELPLKAREDSPGRFAVADRLPEKPFSALSEKANIIPQEAPRPAALSTGDRLTFGFSDVSLYFLNIDFSDIAKAVARDEFPGVVEFEAVISARGGIERLRRTIGSGDPVLDNAIALKFKKAVLKSPWVHEGARYRLRLILRTPKGTNVPN